MTSHPFDTLLSLADRIAGPAEKQAPTIRLVIAGSRTVFPSIEEIDREVQKFVEATFDLEADDYHGLEDVRGPCYWIAEVICGKADGADEAGRLWAKHHGIPVHEDQVTGQDREHWGPYVAPKMRNRRMAERATHGLLWWDGVSGGTSDMAHRLHIRNKPFVTVPFKPRPRQRKRRTQKAT